MRELQEQLIRASATARLDEIVRILRASGDLPATERSWFSELLYPLATKSATGTCQLTASPEVSRIEGNAILDVMLEALSSSPDVAEVERMFRSFAELYSAMTSTAQPLASGLRDRAIDVARRLRRHFLGNETPSLPTVEALAV